MSQEAKKALAWTIILVVGGFATYYIGWFVNEVFTEMGLISFAAWTALKSLGYLILIALVITALLLSIGTIYGGVRWAFATLLGQKL